MRSRERPACRFCCPSCEPARDTSEYSNACLLMSRQAGQDFASVAPGAAALTALAAKYASDRGRDHVTTLMPA
jgi:hypothetical protein